MPSKKPSPRNVFLALAAAILLPAIQGTAQHTKDSTIQQKKMPVLEVRPPVTHAPRNYRAAATRINDLVSTRLAVRFDFKNCYLYGKERVTLKPHFYPTDSLVLDAKGMAIHEIALLSGDKKIPLPYQYDGSRLHIHLNKTYTCREKYTLYIDYTSKPNEYEAEHPGGSAAITDNKGLFFINPHHDNPYMPTEVWTQGETEHNSVWFPTIDKPNQKTMEEISMTVPGSMTTLSNGLLISQKKNKDGTRTDTWKMTHPNSPYLFMMAAGPFVVVKDHWKNIPVNFYVEKKYAPYAKEIFGHTPEMIGFYSRILGVPFPWTKYDQIVARDYVSGAMENTTATLHGEFMYQTSGQMQDFNYYYESVIAHELFHQWFGDLVTCESWSNITLNESFADFAESLWAEHEYGKDLAAQHSYKDMEGYFDFAGSGEDHPLVNYYYRNKEDVFDDVAYQKGGCILRMLRDYLGDSAFFESLHYYLDQHKFHPAEAQQLRLAFEHVTGRDLNWFWNEWYYGKGFPSLDIRYDYNHALHLVRVIVKQTQPGRIFELPFAVDIYVNGKKERHKVMMKDRIDTFTYQYATKPSLINVDGDKVLLAQTDDHKTIPNYIYEYHHAGLYMDRREAIEACAKVQDTDMDASDLLMTALHDKFYGLRLLAVLSLDLKNERIRRTAVPVLKRLILQDKYSYVRAAALTALTKDHPEDFHDLINRSLKDTSLLMEHIGLKLLNRIDPDAAYRQARLLEQHTGSDAYTYVLFARFVEDQVPEQNYIKPFFSSVVCSVLAHKGNAEDFPYIQKNFRGTGGFGKLLYLQPYLYMLSHTITDNMTVKSGLKEIAKYIAAGAVRHRGAIMDMLDNFVQVKQAAAGHAADMQIKANLSGQAAYGRKMIEELRKKPAR